ncbi:MAG TPA: hypothetical protein VGF52_00875, partial [Tepidisphaeraceae bacterium]
TLSADGEDAAIVTVRVIDSWKRPVPIASNEIKFTISGPGKIIGVGNGDPSSHEPDQFVDAVQSVAISNWRMSSIDSTTNRLETAEHFEDAAWRPAFAHRDDGRPPMRVTTNAAYRGDLELPSIDAGASLSLLLRRFGQEQWIYLNGKQIANMSDDDHLSVEVKPGDFHAGKNVIAVIATPRRGSREEISRDENLAAVLRIVTPAGSWKRSLFAGLAQVIVRTNRQEGAIKLTASSGGLTAAMLNITAEPGPERPGL